MLRNLLNWAIYCQPRRLTMCGFVYFKGTSLERREVERSLNLLHHRGPDDTRLKQVSENSWLGFKRLAIMDLSHAGDQPFETDDILLVCNGEIYNFQALKSRFPNYEYHSQSDCEVLVPLFLHGGIEELSVSVDAEFACVIIDKKSGSIFAARDPMGIRPLFYGHSASGEICFASEAKALIGVCELIKPFPPGHLYADGTFTCYLDLARDREHIAPDLENACKGIKERLINAVKKRLQADAPVGYLLSGGLDSSLVCAIAQRFSEKPIRTFAIGMSEDAIDLKYAKEVADFIGSKHTEVIITKDDVLTALNDVVYQLETWDITTVRASIGMYLVCKYIKQNTEIKVLMTGEVSDELFGYKYTDFAPTPEEFQKEAQKRIKELFMYDVLRADRCISAHSLEARVPFSDKEFVEYVMYLDPKIKMNTYGHGKYLLRKAFEGDYLPHSILYREKAAFSDAVGHSMVDYLKQFAQEKVSETELRESAIRYEYSPPFTKESYLYRSIFEGFYPGHAAWVKDFWMPNKSWDNCDVTDPSARVLPNYGTSGA